MAVDVDRVRVLAAEFLRRRGVALPAVDEGGAA
jgi:hypothetical protein